MSAVPIVRRLAIDTIGPGRAMVACARRGKDIDAEQCQVCEHCIGLSTRDSYLVCGWQERDGATTKGHEHPMKQEEETPASHNEHTHASPTPAHQAAHLAAPLGRFERHVVTAKLDDTVFDVASCMRAMRVGSVVVVRNGKPVGMLTDRDIVLRVVAEGLDPRAVLVSSIVTYDAITVMRTDGFETAVRTMREHGVRRVPIVDEEGRLTGIVTADDLVALIGRELSALSEAITSNVDGSESR